MNDKFLIEYTDYIIVYPIKWYNFIKRIINNATLYDNIIIVPAGTLSKNEHTFEEIINILIKHQIIIKKTKNKDLIILYLKAREYQSLFTNWLYFVVLRACLDLFSKIKYRSLYNDDFNLLIGDIKIGFDDHHEYDIIITLNKKSNYQIINYNYNYKKLCEDLKNNPYLQKYLKNV